mmetsp:Transcript_21003/g.33808  ORF Transcript_21003/g.33808 Transcript_21003/m.33808 type:complete len:148 (-) Transcript_21003:265-708(-)
MSELDVANHTKELSMRAKEWLDCNTVNTAETTKEGRRDDHDDATQHGNIEVIGEKVKRTKQKTSFLLFSRLLSSIKTSRKYHKQDHHRLEQRKKRNVWKRILQPFRRKSGGRKKQTTASESESSHHQQLLPKTMVIVTRTSDERVKV